VDKEEKMSFKVVATNIISIVIDRGSFARLGVEFVEKPSRTEEDIIAIASNADAVIVGPEPYTRRVIENLRSCRLICTPKMGYDNIDIAAATEAGICVSNVSSVSIEEVSDHAMALLLACARKLLRLDKTVRTGNWRALHAPEMLEVWRGMVPIRGQTLGLIGFGYISRVLVPKAKGFGLRVLAYDPFAPTGVMEELGVVPADLNRLLKESDYVSVHAALTRENRHMLGAEQFKLMKPTAFLINTARGPLVDEEALYTALKHGDIGGAGLDVLEVEPVRMDNPLLELDNVIFTAHSAHYSDTVLAGVRQRPAEDITRIMAGEWPIDWVNPQVKKNFISRWGKTG